MKIQNEKELAEAEHELRLRTLQVARGSFFQEPRKAQLEYAIRDYLKSIQSQNIKMSE